MSMAKVVLVTGGAGYVGSILVEELIERRFRVRVLDALLHGNRASVDRLRSHAGYSFVQADVRDRAARREALAGVWGVVHLAAIVGDPACARQPDLAREVNLEATRELLEDADSAGVERLVFASTCSNYGRIDGEAAATEDFPLNPVSLYAETKVAAELAVLAHSNKKLTTTCVRLATVFGVSPRMRFDLTVNEFTREAVSARTLVVYGEQFWRPYVHVRDAARGIRLVLEAPKIRVAGQVFNVGSSDENYRKLDLVRLLKARYPGFEVEFVHRDEDPRDYRVSFEKIHEALGFEIETPVPAGIDEVSELLVRGEVSDPYADSYRN
jgi:nucleoside-diphosphate-sugar epimerase